MAHLEFEGKNTEEAIAKACASLALSVEELKFSIITTGSSGIFGLGSRKAKIKVELPDNPPAAEPGPVEPETALAPQCSGPSEASPAGALGEKKLSGPLPSPEKAPETRALPRPLELLSLDSLDIPWPPTQAGPGESVRSGELDELARQSLTVLAEILKLMEFEAELSAVQIANRTIINIDCQEHGLLIGKKGATLDALQFLLSKIVLKDDEAEAQIIVDIEHYRLRRHESIIALAKNMAEKAWRSGRPVVINQLSSPERRIVHMMFKNTPGLRTKSRGEGLFKTLVIIPVGQPDSSGAAEADRNGAEDGRWNALD